MIGIVDKISGFVVADIIDVRFAFAGKIARVNKKPGDKVHIGDLLASLDRKALQVILDKELADYEKTRAEFEIFVIKNPQTSDDRTKYEKVQAQAILNASVKAVELAKINLDGADLFAPVNGVVIDNGGIHPGMFITPGSYAYQILDTGSYVIQVEAQPQEIISLPVSSQVKISAAGKEISGTVSSFIPVTKKGNLLIIKPENTTDLIPGMEVSVVSV
jgi:multidrug resistance efflux pump